MEEPGNAPPMQEAVPAQDGGDAMVPDVDMSLAAAASSRGDDDKEDCVPGVPAREAPKRPAPAHGEEEAKVRRLASRGGAAARAVATWGAGCGPQALTEVLLSSVATIQATILSGGLAAARRSSEDMLQRLQEFPEHPPVQATFIGDAPAFQNGISEAWADIMVIWLSWACWLATTEDAVSTVRESSGAPEGVEEGGIGAGCSPSGGEDDEDGGTEENAGHNKADTHSEERQAKAARKAAPRPDDEGSGSSPTCSPVPPASEGEDEMKNPEGSEDASSTATPGAQSPLAASTSEVDAMVQTIPVILRCFALLREVLRAVIDLTIPSEAARALFDAGAPMEVLEAEVLPESSWQVLTADLEGLLPRAASFFLTPVTGSASTPEAAPLGVATRTQHVNVERLVEAVVTNARATPRPIVSILSEALATLLAGLRRLARDFGRRPAELLTGAAAASISSRHVARNRSSVATALRLALLDACSDRRASFLHDTIRSLLSELPQAVGCREGIPAALEAKWVSRKLQALRRLHSILKSQQGEVNLGDSRTCGVVGMRWLCRCLSRPTAYHEQIVPHVCGEGAWAVLLPSALFLGANDLEDAECSKDEFYFAVLRKTNEMATHAISLGRRPVFPEAFNAACARSFISVVWHAAGTILGEDQCPSAWLSELELLALRLSTAQAPRLNVLEELNGALLLKVAAALQPRPVLDSFVVQQMVGTASVLDPGYRLDTARIVALSPLLQTLASALGPSSLARVLISACHSHNEFLRSLTPAQPFVALGLLGHGRLGTLMVVLQVLTRVLSPSDGADQLAPQEDHVLDTALRLVKALPWQSGGSGRWPWRSLAADISLLQVDPGSTWPHFVPQDVCSAVSVLPRIGQGDMPNLDSSLNANVATDASSNTSAARSPRRTSLEGLNADLLLEEACRLCDPFLLPAMTSGMGSSASSAVADGTPVPPPTATPPPPPGQPPPLAEESMGRRSHGGSLIMKALANAAANKPQVAGSTCATNSTCKSMLGTVPLTGLCTYVKTGSNFVEQHWYYCYTCNFSNEKGVCAVCAQTCHAGHQVVYSRRSRFFCDCGASGCCSAAQKAVTHRSMKDYASWATAQPQQLVEQSENQRKAGCDSLAVDVVASVPRVMQQLVAPPHTNVPAVAQALVQEVVTALVALLKPLVVYLAQCQSVALFSDATRSQQLSEADRFVPEVIPWASFPKGSFECQLRGEWHLGGSRQLGRAVAEVHGVCRRPVAFLSRSKLIVTEKDRVRLVELKEETSSASAPQASNAAGNITEGLSVGLVSGAVEEAAPKRRRLFEEIAATMSKAASPAVPVVAASPGRGGLEETQMSRQVSGQRASEVTKLESCRFSTPFEPLAVVANECFQGLFAITSFEECHLCIPGRAADGGCVGSVAPGTTMGSHDASGAPSGVMHRMALELMLEAHGEAIVVLKVCWLPASKTELAIVTNHFVKIYDLSVDRICPQRYVQILHGVIADCAFEIRRSSMQEVGSRPLFGDPGTTHRLWVLAVSPPMLYHREFGGQVPDGPAVLQKQVALPSVISPRAGLSIAFSQRMGTLLASFDDGWLVVGTPRDDGELQQLHILDKTTTNASAAAFRAERPCATERASGPERLAAYSQLLEWEQAPGMFVGWSRRNNVVHILHLTSKGVTSQPGLSILPVGAPPGSPRSTFEGVALWCQNTETARLAVLMEDGSLHLYTLRRAAAGATVTSTNTWPCGLLALDNVLLKCTDAAGAKQHEALQQGSVGTPQIPEFPCDFFEHAVNLTADPASSKEVSFGGDAPQHYAMEVIRQRLSAQSDDSLQCDVAENAEGFTLELRINCKRRWAPIGVRLLLGHPQRGASGSSPASGPTSMKFVEGQRKVVFWESDTLPTAPSGRRWFDVPFAPWETQACLNRMPVGATFFFPSSVSFAIDALEFYAVPFASFPRQYEAPCLRAAQGTQSLDNPVSLLVCPAVKFARHWLGGAVWPSLGNGHEVMAASEPMAVARELAVSTLSCLAAFQQRGGASYEQPPAEVLAAAQLWQDSCVNGQALHTIAAFLPGRPSDVATIELLIAADFFLELFSESANGFLSVPLAAFASEWCRQMNSGREQSCRNLLQKRPACAEALGNAVCGVLMQRRNLYLCPPALLGSLITAAVTSAVLQLAMRLEDCFCTPPGGAQTAEAPPEATEALWQALCESEENASHFDTITSLLTLPHAPLRDYALRALFGLPILQTCAAGPADGFVATGSAEGAGASTTEEKDVKESSSAWTSFRVKDPSKETPSSCGDGSDVEEDEEMQSAVGYPTATMPAVGAEPLPAVVHAAGEASTANPGAELLPLLLLSYLTACLCLDEERWASLHRADMAIGAGLFEASQRLVLVCLEARSLDWPSSRYALLFKLVLGARAAALESVVRSMVLPKFAQLRDADGKPLSLMQDMSASGDTAAQDAEGGAATQWSEDFLCACVSLLGSMLTALLRALERRSLKVVRELLAGFVQSATALMLPMFTVLHRNIDLLAPRDVRVGFLAIGGTPPPRSEEGLMKVPFEIPPSHFHGFLPAAWAEACDAEGCHVLERPLELLTMSTLALLMSFLRLARSDCCASSTPPFSATLAAFAGVLSEASKEAAANAARVAKPCGEVLTKLALVCGGLDDSSSPLPVLGVLAFAARSLLYEMCACATLPYHRLLDFALFSRIEDDLRPHVALEAICSSTMGTNTQITAYVEACRALWAAAKIRPWTWAQFAAGNVKILEYCLTMGHALAARYGCSPLNLVEVAESASLAFRLVALALAAPPQQSGTFTRPMGQWFRWIIETSLCSASIEVRQSAALALALVFDEHCRPSASAPSKSATEEVRVVLRRGMEALFVSLGARASELASLACYVLSDDTKATCSLGVDSSAANIAQVIGSLTRHLCRLHLNCAVPLLNPRDVGSSHALAQRSINIDEVASQVATLRTAAAKASDVEAEVAAAAAAATAAVTATAGRSSPRPQPAPTSGTPISGAAMAGTTTSSPTTGNGGEAATQRPRGCVCGICAELILPMKPIRLESLRADLKFSDEKMWVRFGEAMSVNTLGIVVHEHLLRQGGLGRHIGHTKVYYNDVHVQDVATLKAQSDKQGWQPLCILYFEPTREGMLGSTKTTAAEVSATLPTPVTCCNLLFEYFESTGGPFGCPALQEGGRLLVCPRCHRPAGKSGICNQCGDNAFQCPKCRNINYEKLDALFCNDCGYCRFLKMETWLTCRPTHEKHVAPLRDETECRQASEALEGLVRQVRGLETSSGAGNAAGASSNTQTGSGGSATAANNNSTPATASSPGARPSASTVKRATSQEDLSLRTFGGIVDLRQKILQYRRGHPCSGVARDLGSGSAVVAAHLPAAPLLGAKCEACVLTILLCALQLLSKALEASCGHESPRTRGVVLAALTAAVPYGMSLLEDMLLPLALRCPVPQVRSASRKALLALSGANPQMDQALCLELGRSICESTCGSTAMACRTSPEQAREETLLLMELVLAVSSSRQWLDRLPLLSRALSDSISAKHLVITAQVAIPSLLLALKGAQELHRTLVPSASPQKAVGASLDALRPAHLYALLFPDFLGPAAGSAGGEERAVVLTVRVASKWRMRSSGTLNRSQGKLAVQRSRDWLIEALTHAGSPPARRLARDILETLLAARLGESIPCHDSAATCAGAETGAPASGAACEAPSEDELPKRPQGRAALRILDRLRVSVLEARPRPNSEAALQVMISLLSEPRHWTRRTYCAATGWMPLLRSLILDECAALVPASSMDDGGLWSQGSVFPAWLEVHHGQSAQAESLVGALKLLHLLLAEPLLAPRRRKEGFELAECILTSMLTVRSVLQSHLLQSAHLCEASTLLEKVLKQLQVDQSSTEAGDFGAEQKFLAACIRTLRSEDLARKMRFLGLPLSAATKFTFEQIAGLLCPERRERSVLLHLQKASSQEEYIRGQMRKNPYVSLEIGPTMRHVREKIASDLNIRDAMEIMELLVGDKIIGLDLPVAQVYEQVWVPFVINRRERLAEQAAAERGASGERADAASEPANQAQAMWDFPPMTVIFRLSGLDGEATEDMVETLPDVASEAEEAQAERRKDLCKTFCKIGGITAVVEHLEAIIAERGQESSLEVLDVLLWIALAVGEVEAARREFLDLGGLRALLAHLLRTIDEMCARKTAEKLGPLEARVAERLLSMVETLARERGAFEQQCLQPLRAPEGGAGEYSAKDHVSLLLSLLCQTEPGTAAESVATLAASRSPSGGPPQWVQKMRTQVASLLPFLTFGQPAPVEVLVRASTPLPLPGLKATEPVTSPMMSSGEGGAPSEAREALSLDLVTAMVGHVPSDPAIGGAVRAAFFRAGAVSELLRYLEQVLPQEPCEKSSPRWVKACQAQGLPAALRILAGLTANFVEAQRLVADRNNGRLLKVLLRLEGTAVSSMQQSALPAGETGVSAQVGACAEGLLEALKQGNEDVGQTINHLRRLQQKAKSSRANQSRQKILKTLGMSPTNPLGLYEASETPVAEELPKQTRQLEAHTSTGSVTEELMNFEDIHEDLRCCVCQEGYHFQPEEVLCVYTFVKPMAINASSIAVEEGTPEGGPSATKAAANLRPKAQGEWESATVRNSSSKCNALIPVFGPSLPDASATQALERHFNHLGQVAKGNSASVLNRRAACTLHDLRLCFARLACQESFSLDTGGGGPRHNMCLALIMFQLLSHEALAAELSEELGDLERLCVEPLLDFRSPEEVSQVVERYRIKGQPSGPHPGHLWALGVLATLFRAGTPGGGSTLEWSAGTLWRLLAVALEISRQFGSMKWDQRRPNSPISRPGTPQSGTLGSPSRTPQASPRTSRGGGSACGSPPRLGRSPGSLRPSPGSSPLPHDMELSMPGLELEPQALEPTHVEEDPDVSMKEIELELLADAVPMLRFLAICDVFRWRLERWSRGEGGEDSSGGRASDSVAGPSNLSDENLGTPLLSRPALRRRLRRFDGPLLEVGEAVAHLFSNLSSPAVLWRFFLYRLGDDGTPEFNVKLPPHGGKVEPVELLRPPKMKADPSLPEIALLPRHLIKSASAREAVGQASRD